MKNDKLKPDYTLVPTGIIKAVQRVREYGVKKYSDPDNWKTVSIDRYWKALLRHTIEAWNDPAAVDPESGLMHIEHIACNIAFILALMGEDNDC